MLLFLQSRTYNTVFVSDKKGFVQGIIVRPVEKGEELTFSFSELPIKDYKERQDFLCYENNLLSNPNLASDPDFNEIILGMLNRDLHIDLTVIKQYLFQTKTFSNIHAAIQNKMKSVNSICRLSFVPYISKETT